MEWNGREIDVTRPVLGYEMRAHITQLPQEICILLTGGVLPHIGTVSIYETGNLVDSIVLNGHKNHYVGNRWAEKISLKKCCKVTVICGIHYDRATAEMLEIIQDQAEILLNEVMSILN